MIRRQLLAPLAGLALVGLALAGCTGPTGASDLMPTAAAAPTTTTTTPAPPATPCSGPTKSYAPQGALPGPGAMPAGSTMAKISARGKLVVGVSADTYLLGFRNPISGRLEGFDIDLLREVSTAIFGSPDKIEYRVITSGQRIDVLTSGKVDLVARAFTITCDRWNQIAFSAEYYHAGQKVLVPSDSGAKRIEDLKGKRVCAPKGTTTLTRLEKYGQIKAVPADTHTQCLALFQEGRVDAITGDDTILAGFVRQDPYAKVVGAPLSDEPYGVGVAKGNRDLVRFVNGVLEKWIADGEWAASYQTWFSVLGAPPAPPRPVYGRS